MFAKKIIRNSKYRSNLKNIFGPEVDYNFFPRSITDPRLITSENPVITSENTVTMINLPNQGYFSVVLNLGC